MNNHPDFDSLLDYRSLYSSEVQSSSISGNTLSGLCPFHNDKHVGNFHVNLDTGVFNCFSCHASGNYISFVAKKYGISNTDAIQKICIENHIDMPTGKRKAMNAANPRAKEYTIADYAADKHLDPGSLRTDWGLTDGLVDSVGPYIRIPYLDSEGYETTFRKRYPKGCKTRFMWKRGSTSDIKAAANTYCFYGLQFLKQIKQQGFVILVEGESDTQTLWHMGFPALGVPGAMILRAEWVSTYISDIPCIYIHREPDQGGSGFADTCCKKLSECQFGGTIKVFSCGSEGVKDPSELWIKFSDSSKEKLQNLLDGAETYSLEQQIIKPSVDGMDKVLRIPPGFLLDENGIYKVDETTGATFRFCATPIQINRFLHSLDTDEFMIELAFKRSGQVRTVIDSVSNIFSSRTIVDRLANKGVAVSSENAKAVVSWLSALEAENMDILVTDDMTEQTGWQNGGRFMPYFSEGLTMSPFSQKSLSALCHAGSLNDWVAAMKPHRERWRFRFILAAAFAAPLLKLLNCRNFCVYNWGDSRGGKTAALKAALSVYGDPDHLMLTFNATDNALESSCALYNDLAVGIDEKQITNRDLAGLMYKLTEGIGKRVLNRDRSLRDWKTWTNLFFVTGEQTIINSSTMTGVSTRIIEVQGSPFRDFKATSISGKEAEKTVAEHRAAQMYSAIHDNFGWAGESFIGHFRSDDSRTELRNFYEAFKTRLTERCPDNNASHIACVAAVGVADFYSSIFFFEDSDPNSSLDLCVELLQQVSCEQEDVRDVSDGAIAAIADWIMMNRIKFDEEKDTYEHYGYFDTNYVCVIPKVLERALQDMGYDYRKTMSEMKSRNMLRFTIESGKRRWTIRTKYDGGRYVCIDRDKLFGFGTDQIFLDEDSDDEDSHLPDGWES